MCEPTTITAAVAAGTAIAGGAMQYKASQNQQNAMANTRLDEVSRQGQIMRDNMAMQSTQRQDALQSRKQFNEQTLPAFTRESIDRDQATEQTRLQSALSSAGARALTPSTGDAAASSSNVSVGGGPSAPSNNSRAFQAALGSQMGYQADYADGQTKAQAAMAALSRAQQLGGERLQNAGIGLSLNNAKLNAYNRAINANGLYSNASGQLYQSEAEAASNKGAGLALAGTTLSALGNAGYSYASRG